jgi:hypothetical protein
MKQLIAERISYYKIFTDKPIIKNNIVLAYSYAREYILIKDNK